MSKFAAVWESSRSSLWFLPAVIVAGAVLCAWLAVQVDLNVGPSEGLVWWINQGSAEEAGKLLSALLGSLITMVTLVISITMVVLTLAAGQLGPRLIRNFVGDRHTQIVIGVFLGTVVYIFLIYRLLDSDLNKGEVPHFAVTLASVLVLLCLGLLLYYVHHLSRSIVADTVVSRVGRELDGALNRDFPDATAVPSLFEHRSDAAPGRLALDRSGYVQTIDYAALVGPLSKHEAIAEILVRPGHHVIEGRTHARIWPAAALDDTLRSAFKNAVMIGLERTPVQDVEFSVRQLVEIALRALSPGINDPFTAIAVIDRLGASLALAVERGEAQSVWRDEDGAVRLIVATSSFGGIADLSFNQIRQAAASHPDVLISLIDTLGALAEKPRTEEQRAALLRHLDAIMETGRRSIAHSADLASLSHRYEAARETAGAGTRT